MPMAEGKMLPGQVAVSDHRHVCKWIVLVDMKDNTTSPRCKGQVARCKGQDNISPSVRVAVSVTQAGVTCISSCELHSLKVATEKNNHNLAPELVAYALRRSFSHASHQCGHDSLSLIAVYTVTGGAHYCDHLESSGRWCAQRAASICMCS